MVNRLAVSPWICFAILCLAVGGLALSSDVPKTPVPAVIPPNGGPTWQVAGTQVNAGFGRTLASAGDVNGDGIADIIVGAPFFDSPSTPNTQEGRAYVYLGSALGPSTVPAWTADGAQTGFATSVASAGDVNGDGFDDIIVGDPYFVVYQPDGFNVRWTGQAYVYLGSASGPAATPAWTGHAGQLSQFGFSVASAGDVNGDGYADVIVGAPSADPPAAAYVYLGSPSGLSATPAWSVIGPRPNFPGGGFGAQVASAGDVNGDGYGDVLVGEPGYGGGCTIGRAYLYIGSASGLYPDAAWTREGSNCDPTHHLGLGSSLASGHFDGDQYSDIVLGAANAGAMLFRGSPGGPGSSPDWTSHGENVARNAGDVNGDHFDDLITGPPFVLNNPGGSASIYTGGPSGLSAAPVWTVSANQASSSFGSIVAGAGDTDGDGLANVLVGADAYDGNQFNDGAAFLFFGPVVVACGTDLDGDGYCATGPGADCNDTDPKLHPNAVELCNGSDDNCDGRVDEGFGVGTACTVGLGVCKVLGQVVCTVDGSARCDSPAPQLPSPEICDGIDNDCDGVIDDGLADPDSCRIASTPQSGARLGTSVADVGDVNGDGFDDVLAGAPYDGQGRINLYYGSASGRFRAPDWTYAGTQTPSSPPTFTALFGSALAGIGDLNHDGYDDFIVGAPGYNSFKDLPPGGTLIGSAGAAYLFNGGPGGPTLAATFSPGSGLPAMFGSAVAGGGDIDGDGVPDFAIAQRQTTFLALQTPQVRVYTQSGAGPTVIVGPFGSEFGASVAIVPDVNGDGLDEVLVGMPGSEQAALYYGQSGGPSSFNRVILQGADGFGTSVAGAGDVNHDGFGDILIGGNSRATLYLGSAAGLTTTPAWFFDGGQTGFGKSVASAGDINRDGYADFIVGAVDYPIGSQIQGAAFVFLGGPGGPDHAPFWFGSPANQAGAQVGWAVSGAGDYNGDGYDDLVIGAPGFNSGRAVSAGRVDLMLTVSPLPHAVIAAPTTAECVAGGAVITLDGSASTDVDSTPGTNDDIASFDWYDGYGTPGQLLLGGGRTLSVGLSLGAHAITLVVTDHAGHTGAATTTVTVRDTLPPTLVLHADPSTLWPPNHGLVTVNATWETGDVCDPAGVGVQLISLTSSEPDDAAGGSDGATTQDIGGAAAGTPNTTFLLRAERDAHGPGRIYTLTYGARDASGNATTALATVIVPHDQGQGPEPLLMRLEPVSPGATSARIFWPAVAGATGYDVITGDLGSWHAGNGTLNLGPVQVLARSTTATSLNEPAGAANPAVGHAIFYLIEQRTADGGAGYGTESAPWPRVASMCDGGCPGAPPPAGSGPGTNARK